MSRSEQLEADARLATPGPSPAQFYATFAKIVLSEQATITSLWDAYREYTAMMRSSLFPSIAKELALECYPGDYYTLDAVFYREKDTVNFAGHLTYAHFISVALEHENYSEGTAVEINKLQLFNAPLKVLITYPGTIRNADKLLARYATMIKAADVFEDFSTLRRQLVIFGRKEKQQIPVWSGFEYRDGGFHTVG